MKSFAQKNKFIIYSALALATFGSAVFIGGDIMMIFFSFLWIACGLFFRVNDKFFLGLSLLSLILSFPLFLMGKVFVADKIAAWQFMFIIIGFLLLLIKKYYKNGNSFSHERKHLKK